MLGARGLFIPGPFGKSGAVIRPIATADALALGATPGSGAASSASQGVLRLTEDFRFYMRQGDDAADRLIASGDAANNLTLGGLIGGGGGAERVDVVDLNAQSGVRVYVAAGNRLNIQSTLVTVGSTNGLQLDAGQWRDNVGGGTMPATGNFRVSGGTATWGIVCRDGAADVILLERTTGGRYRFGAPASAAPAAVAVEGHNVIPIEIVQSANTAWRSVYDAGGGADTYRISLGAVPASWQSALGAFFLRNGNTEPTGNPTSGVFFWPTAGALKVRSPNGTVTTLASAGVSQITKFDVQSFNTTITAGTTNNIATFTPPANSEWLVFAFVTARDSTADRNFYLSAIGVKKGAADCTLVGGTDVFAAEDDAAWSVTGDAPAGGTWRLRGTADAANATTFTAHLLILERAA